MSPPLVAFSRTIAQSDGLQTKDQEASVQKYASKEPTSGQTKSFAGQGSSLSQAPHSNEERALESAIGGQVRAMRRERALTTTALGEQAGLSPSMLSRIENGTAAPSLATLQALGVALSVPISHFFQRFERAWQVSHVKAGKGLPVERRGTKAGHDYHLLGHPVSSGDLHVEPFLITMTEDSQPFPVFQHAGTEFLYILSGEVLYRHGDKEFLLKRGDSLFFEASAPHGPQELRRLPLRFLSLIAYRTETP